MFVLSSISKKESKLFFTKSQSDKITLVYTKIQFSEGGIFSSMKNCSHSNNNNNGRCYKNDNIQ